MFGILLGSPYLKKIKKERKKEKVSLFQQQYSNKSLFFCVFDGN